MICPNCKRSNRCNCESCNPTGIASGSIIDLSDGYKCFWCSFEFSPDQSLDAEWEIMVDRIMEKISRDYVLGWILDGENPSGFDRFELERASFGHLKINPNYQISEEILIGLRRSRKIDKII